MKKKYLIYFLLLFYWKIDIVFASSELDACSDVGVLQTFRILDTVIKIIKILVPIILIVLAAIELAKAVLSANDNEINDCIHKLGDRLIIGVVIFFVPTIVTSVFDTIDYSSSHINLSTCLNNSKNIDYYKKLRDQKLAEKTAENQRLIELSKQIEASNRRKREEQFQELLREQMEIERQLQASQRANEVTSTYVESTPQEGSFVGQTYNLSASDMNFLANVAECEQGVGGAAAELSLIANRYELFGSSYSSIVNYTQNSNWFACARNASSSSANSQIIAIVQETLVLGNRTLPFYINEHDCINCAGTCNNGNRGDVCEIVTNGSRITDMSQITNRAGYVSNNTVIYNPYSSVYTFYSFPCSTCDPFGYTESALQKYNSYGGR